MLTRIRIWLPDAPGVLGAVAAEIGAVNGNVIGLEGVAWIEGVEEPGWVRSTDELFSFDTNKE